MNTEDHSVRCFIYCWKGREATDFLSVSLPNQEKRLIEYAERNEINIVGIFRETTKNLNKNSKFFEILRRIKRKEANGILILNKKCIPTYINYYSKLLRMFEQNLIVEFISAE